LKHTTRCSPDGLIYFPFDDDMCLAEKGIEKGLGGKEYGAQSVLALPSQWR
jgi:hypothetical protein